MTQRIYLASRSPRRRELLDQIGVTYEVLVFRDAAQDDEPEDARGHDADIDETPFPDEAVARYVERLALTKAVAGWRRARWRKLPDLPILAADTTLELDGEIIGKPTSTDDAYAILQRLSGRAHRVLTAIALTNGERTRSALSVSEVRFRPLSAAEIRAYVASGEPMDKAGAYGIQGRAAVFVEHIAGSYSGIMGLPLFETAQLLAAFDHPVLS